MIFLKQKYSLKNLYPFFELKLISFAEREIHQVVGHITQLPADRPEHVPEQFSGILTRSTPGSQGHCGPSHQHHFLQDEGEHCPINHKMS